MTENLIVSDPQILGGKPCVRGRASASSFSSSSRLAGHTGADLAQYPQLTRAGLSAVFGAGIDAGTER